MTIPLCSCIMTMNGTKTTRSQPQVLPEKPGRASGTGPRYPLLVDQVSRTLHYMRQMLAGFVPVHHCSFRSYEPVLRSKLLARYLELISSKLGHQVLLIASGPPSFLPPRHEMTIASPFLALPSSTYGSVPNASPAALPAVAMRPRLYSLSESAGRRRIS